MKQDVIFFTIFIFLPVTLFGLFPNNPNETRFPRKIDLGYRHAKNFWFINSVLCCFFFI